MATFSKKLLSGSTNGRGIPVVATATPGTLIHTAVANTANFDEIWLYAYNSHTTAVLLTIEFGGVAAPGDNIKITVPAQSGEMQIVPGLLLTGSVIVRAFAATASVVVIKGFVNQIA